MTTRQAAELGPLDLELGGRLPSVTLAHETWGEPRRDADGRVVNAVLVLHALTGDSHVAGWWGAVLGPGRPLDTDRWYVVAANVLGGCRGSTGPASPGPDGRRLGSRFPEITIRDQVAAEVLLADRLGVDRFASVLGGSMGGMRALEWLVGHPGRAASALVLAAAPTRSAPRPRNSSPSPPTRRGRAATGWGRARSEAWAWHAGSRT